jgi:HK97 family phage prohead protease
MLRFEMDVAAVDENARTIEGVVVPYNEVGTIAGRGYRFAPGSVRAARSRTPLLVDHDRGQPVGVLDRLTESPRGLLGRFRIDATAAGDTALLQAASGSRGALSIGAELVAARPSGDVIDVDEALLVEASLLALGAFASATVTHVAAEADEPDPDEPVEPAPPAEPHPDQPELPVEPDEPTPAPPADPEPEEGTTMTTEAGAAPVIIHAAADRPQRELTAGELVGWIVRAQHGEADARRFLEAALTESISTDVSGLLPPQYERTVIGGKPTPRPLYGIFSSRPLPGVGLAVNKPKWTTRPDGAWAATVDDDAHSTKVVIGSQAANILRWDWAGAIPWVVVQRSDPSIIDEIYSEAVQDFYLDVETSIAALMAAAATNAATSLGAAVGAFFTANHRSPEVVVVAPDVWGKLADRGALQVPVAGASVGVEQYGLTATWGGLPIVASASLAATFGYLATRRALDVRVTDPVRLTANAIGALNVELAVVGEGLFDTDYAGELVEFVPNIPAPTGLEGGTGRSSKA